MNRRGFFGRLLGSALALVGVKEKPPSDFQRKMMHARDVCLVIRKRREELMKEAFAFYGEAFKGMSPLPYTEISIDLRKIINRDPCGNPSPKERDTAAHGPQMRPVQSGESGAGFDSQPCESL